MNFSQFKLAVAKQFALMSQGELFQTTTPKDQLWGTYLASFPPGTNPIYRERTEHDCSSCRSFIKAVGGVVAIINGKRVSIWDIDPKSVDKAYAIVAANLSTLVSAHPIENVFRSTEAQAGVDKNFEQLVDDVKTWNHFHVVLPKSVVLRNTAIGPVLSQIRADFDVFYRSLTEISIDAVDTVLELIAQNSLYRGAEHKTTLEKFHKAKRDFDNIDQDHHGARENFVWSQRATMPSSVLRIRNTSIGTLLVDLSDGLELEDAVKKFEAMVAPSNYKRPTALVTPKMIEAAKAKLEELGLTNALERRYATLNDIHIDNLLFADRSIKSKVGGDVFDELQKETKVKTLNKVEEVPIDAFIKDILPNAKSLEVLVENRHVGNFTSLITAANPTAPQLFQWANPFSWSYTGNVADSIKARVKAAGGNVTGELCCRLAWEYSDDLDFHMYEPNGSHIYFSTRRERSINGGKLDVDANGGDGLREHPVENIFYERISTMRDGEYKLRVNNWCRRSDGRDFEVEIDLMGQITHLTYEGVVRDGSFVDVATLTVKKGKIEITPHLSATHASKKTWGITTQTFVPVQAIMYSPNHWGEQGVGNKHLFFMLDGCKNEDVARGFYNEFLRSDIAEHRKVLEMVGSRMKTDNSDSQLSGLGFSFTQHNTLTVRVKGNFNRTINIIF